MANKGLLELNDIIDPALLYSFPSDVGIPSLDSTSALSELCLDYLGQVATGKQPVAAAKPVTVEYETIDEARQALQDARKKTLQKLQFINQQIEYLEGMKQNRDEALGPESVEESYF